MKKYLLFLALALTACNTSPANTDTDMETGVSTSVDTENRYTDTKTGISFYLPPNWLAGPDESGNLYIHRTDPYETVSFRVFETKEEWETSIDSFKNSKRSRPDTIVEEKEITVAGYPTTMIVLDRMGEFRYSEYFIDGAIKWLEVSTSDQREDSVGDIQKVIASLEF